MSTFSSILASIGRPSQSTTAGASTANVSSVKKGSPTTTTDPHNSGAAGIKRKAQDITRDSSDKLSHSGALSATGQQNKDFSRTKPIAGKASETQSHLQHQPRAQTSSSSATTPLSRPAPKNSFREIMARAEAAKARQNDFGRIKHKQTVKLTKRQRRLAREAEISNQTDLASSQSSRNLRGQARDAKINNHNISSTSKRPITGLNYKKDTTRPRPALPAYKGTMKPSAPTAASLGRSKATPGASSGQAGRQYHYASYSDDEDDYDDEYDDEDDIDGGVDDMGATGFEELEREEEESLRAARKEDEEALREEKEHKRQKAERRKKLEALAAARGRK